MTEPVVRLFVGDPYRCERALADRDAALCADNRVLEHHVRFADDVDAGSLELDLTSLSLFALGRHFVVRRVEKARAPKAFARLVDIPFADETYLTLIADDLRATNPIAKAAKVRDALVSLPAPRGAAIRTSAKEILAERGVVLAEPALRQFLHRCGDDLLTIAQEADKLRCLGAAGPMIDEATVERAVFPSAERTAYPFYDRLGERDLAATLSELRDLREEPGRILSGILRHLTRLAMIRVLLERRIAPSEMAAPVGVQDWLLRRLTGQAKRRSQRELAAALRLGVDLDRQIKTGLVDPADALLSLVLVAAGPAATTRPPRRAPG